MRILVAEDDPKLLKSLVHIFKLNHYAVDGVNNGNDALDFASSDEYDITIDMISGFDTTTAGTRTMTVTFYGLTYDIEYTVTEVAAE